MTLRPLPLAAALLAGGLTAMPTGASAAVSFGVLPQALASTTVTASQTCPATVSPALGATQAAPASVRIQKSSAILGGQMSALERLRLQQAGQAPAPSGIAQPAGLVAPVPQSRVQAGANCQKFAQNLAMPILKRPATGPVSSVGSAGSEDFLASKRLPVRRTSFDAAWNRVRNQGLSRGTVSSLKSANPGPVSMATLSAVNAWTNARVRYVEDKDLYGRADYWASASATLSRRAGDCEDIAIAKMQVLAALGVSRSDMYLTVARDLARNADHAVLVVKFGGKHWLLDNSTNQVLDARTSHDYRPIMSFSTSKKWLHGYSAL